MDTTTTASRTGSHLGDQDFGRPLMGWMSAIALILFFAAALIAFPPLADASKNVPIPEWAKFLGRFHVVALHMPVGVFILAAFMEFVCFVNRKHGSYLVPATTFVLHVAAWGAAIAVIFGILLSRKGGFGSGLFQAHQTLGIIAAIGVIFTLVLKLVVDGQGGLRWLYRGLFSVSLMVLSLGAHFGGDLVHGEDYLVKYAPTAVREAVSKYSAAIIAKFEPAKTEENNPTPPLVPIPPVKSSSLVQEGGNATVYAALVAPLLEAKCNACHNEDKHKADLRLDTHEQILKGSENGAVLVVGLPEKSKLLTSMTLPMDDDDHMPPEKEKQPTKEEIALVGWWIKEGARADLKVAEAKFPEEIQSLVQTMLARSKGGSTGGPPPVFLFLAEATANAVDPAVAEAMKKINGSGASLAPLSADSKELRFTALNVAKDFKDASIKDLEPVADKIVALDLARSAVTDAVVASIAKMKNLRELHLENTAITDAGAAQLKTLANLEYLNLYGTKITDKALAELGALSKLKALYVWQTGVSKPAADAFKAKHPNAVVNAGWSEADNAKLVAIAAPPAAATDPKAPVASAKPDAPKPAPVAAAVAKPDAPKPAPAVAAPAKPEAPKPAPAPAAAPSVKATVTAAVTVAAVASNSGGTIFKDIVEPILAAKCTACHGTEKSKGKLKLHTFADTLKGGSDGKTTVIPGKPEESLMIKRPKLPADDDDHMPPKDEKQLTKEEMSLLAWWIEQGASDTLTVALAKKTPDIDTALKVFAENKPVRGAPAVAKGPVKPKAKPLTDAEKKAVAEVTAKMSVLNASLMPLALDTEQLRFGCVNAADKFGDKELAELAPISAHVLWADFARSKITDGGLATVSKMDKLERLHLENTAVTDAGIEQLANLKGLEYLNLYGTKVTDAGIAKLSGNKSLKKLFVWQTAVTKDGAKKLEALVPGLVVNVGLSEAEIAKLVEAAKPPAPVTPPPAAKPEPKKPEPPKPADPKKAEPPKPEVKPGEKPIDLPPPPKPDAKPAPKK